MNVDSCFTDNYGAARERFLDACRQRRLEVYTFEHPEDSGRAGLAIDSVLIGSERASRLLILTSGVHGIELFCGSGCQVGLLQEHYFDALPDDLAVLLVHAVNPWGALHQRRVTEDNVDLCRNCIDFSARARPDNADYAVLDAELGLSDNAVAGAGPGQNLDKTVERCGFQSVVNTLMAGQYTHPEGFGFGGSEPTWSQRTLADILERLAAGARHVCVIDIHSGLGPYGYGMIVSLQNGAALKRAKRWFGGWAHSPSGHGTHAARGHTTQLYERVLSAAEVTAVTLEYGTFDAADNFRTLIDEHLAYRQGSRSREILDRMRAAHLPDDPDWRDAVLSRVEQVFNQALRGLRQ